VGLAPAYFKMVEHELFNYDVTKAEIERLKDEIINKPPVAGEQERVQESEVSNPTERKGLRLVSNTALLHMERTVGAIERALMQLEEEHNEIFELRYRQGLSWREVLSQTYMAQNSYFRKRRELVNAVAVNLGLILPDEIAS